MEEGLEEILESSCGLDVHKDKIEACILKTGAKAAYRERFGCISSELDRLCTSACPPRPRDIAVVPRKHLYCLSFSIDFM